MRLFATALIAWFACSCGQEPGQLPPEEIKPDPDIIIRTGGEKRLSGFLPWQAVYSELFFTDTLWPDFKKEEFGAILTEFTLRERRRGK